MNSKSYFNGFVILICWHLLKFTYHGDTGELNLYGDYVG